MKRVIVLTCLSLLFLSSCVGNQESGTSTVSLAESTVSTEVSLVSSESHALHIRYDVYEMGASDDGLDEFSAAMLNNPISQKMTDDFLNHDIGVNELSEYVEIWKQELSSSIDSLKKYLSAEDVTAFDAAQIAWENSIKANNGFDQKFIEDKNIQLGRQYAVSVQLHLINQYSERVYHIKYMTYLYENYTS